MGPRLREISAWLLISETGSPFSMYMYRAEKKSLKILLSSTQAGPGRKVKQEQKESSRNHVPRLFLGSVCLSGVISDKEKSRITLF